MGVKSKLIVALIESRRECLNLKRKAHIESKAALETHGHHEGYRVRLAEIDAGLVELEALASVLEGESDV